MKARASCTITIPPNSGYQNQIAVHFYFDAGGGQLGMPVRAARQDYMDVYGNAACAAMVYNIPPEGVNTTWMVWIPYDALAVPVGQWMFDNFGNQFYQPAASDLVAEATLFIDNFGVSRGPLVPFNVT